MKDAQELEHFAAPGEIGDLAAFARPFLPEGKRTDTGTLIAALPRLVEGLWRRDPSGSLSNAALLALMDDPSQRMEAWRRYADLSQEEQAAVVAASRETGPLPDRTDVPILGGMYEGWKAGEILMCTGRGVGEGIVWIAANHRARHPAVSLEEFVEEAR